MLRGHAKEHSQSLSQIPWPQLVCALRRERRGLEEMDRSVKGDMEGGDGQISSLPVTSFKLKIYQNLLATELRPDPQEAIKRFPKLAEPQWAAREGTIPHTPSRSYGRLGIGNGRRRRTGSLRREILV